MGWNRPFWKPLTPGTYYYVIELNDADLPIRRKPATWPSSDEGGHDHAIPSSAFSTVLGALGALSTVDAQQQLPLRTNWQFNYFQENPAFAGFTDCMELKAGFRQQWAGFDGAPSTAFANLQGRSAGRPAATSTVSVAA